MTRNTKKLMIYVGLAVGAWWLLGRKSGGANPTGPDTRTLAGAGWAAVEDSLNGWFPNGGASVTQQDRYELIADLVPESVTRSDWEKYANGSAYGGGYTEQDRMLLDSVVT